MCDELLELYRIDKRGCGTPVVGHSLMLMMKSIINQVEEF